MGDHNIIKSKKQAPLPLVTRFKLLMFKLIRNACTRPDGTVNRRLFSLIDFKTSAPATKLIKTIQVSTSDITIDPSRNLWFRLFIPSHAEKLLPLIVYFHGGGFSNYGADSKVYNDLCVHLAAAVPAVIVSVNYRLSPEHKYPSQYEDGFDVLKFIDSNILPAKIDLSNCFIGGDSAGGNIAHHVTVRAVEKAEEFSKIRIIGMVGLQPFFGGEERSESEVRLTKAPLLSVKQTDVFWREFLPEGADRDHPAANVFGKNINHDFPTSLVVVGGNDPLQDWDRRYVEWLKSSGKCVEVTEYPNAFHGFYAFPEVPEFDLLIHRVATFVHKQ
ncbi:hypothetical protein C2S53_005589, partial [Perilla frutescens var. hirtella]